MQLVLNDIINLTPMLFACHIFIINGPTYRFNILDSWFYIMKYHTILWFLAFFPLIILSKKSGSLSLNYILFYSTKIKNDSMWWVHQWHNLYMYAYVCMCVCLCMQSTCNVHLYVHECACICACVHLHVWVYYVFVFVLVLLGKNKRVR